MHFLHDQRMVLRQLLNRTLTNEVNATVANVSERDKVVIHQNAGNRGSHARLILMTISGFANSIVGELNCLSQGLSLVGNAIWSICQRKIGGLWRPFTEIS